MRKLAHGDVATYRRSKAASQKYRCPICEGHVGQVGALDHCHKTGNVRSVLCGSCNEGEGKVLAAIKFRTPKTNLAYKDNIQWLKNLIKYWELWDKNRSGVIHPTFDLKTGKQKPKKRRKKI